MDPPSIANRLVSVGGLTEQALLQKPRSDALLEIAT